MKLRHSPVFRGRIGNATVLEGDYALPGGDIAMVDRALLNVAARSTARSLLAAVGESLRSQA